MRTIHLLNYASLRSHDQSTSDRKQRLLPLSLVILMVPGSVGRRETPDQQHRSGREPSIPTSLLARRSWQVQVCPSTYSSSALTRSGTTIVASQQTSIKRCRNLSSNFPQETPSL